MKIGYISPLIILALIAYGNFCYAQYCTPLYGFQTNRLNNEVFVVQVNAETGTVSNELSTLENSIGVITSALNINNHTLYYIELSLPRFITINTTTGESIPTNIEGLFDVRGLTELEYNCEDEILYGFRESNNGIDLVSVEWEAEQINDIFRFNTSDNQIKSSAINANTNFIFLLTSNNVLHSYNLSAGAAAAETLSVEVIEIEYDVNDNVIYAYLESGAFGSIENGVFTQIGNNIEPQGEPISTAFDPFTNTFFIANNTTLFAINAQTGDIINEFTLSEPLYRLNAGIPCQIEADFYPENTCIDLPIQFIDNSVGATQWLWDFGDGIGTSTQQNPSYTYTNEGMYEVNLQVSGCELGVDDTTQIINVTKQPVVDLGGDTMQCGQSYRIDPGIFDPSFELTWTFGVKEPTFNVTRDGTYALSVKNGSCFGTDSISVTLLDAPKVNLGDDQSFCETVELELDAENPTLDIIWSTGATSPTISINSRGIYWVDVSNSICTTRDSISVELFEAIEINLGDNVDICADSYELDAGISGANIAYLWSNGATTQTTKITNSGTYSVEVSNGDCLNTDEVMINFVNDINTTLGEDITACEGESIQLDAGANADGYLWNDGSTNQILAVNESGNYKVEIFNQDCRTTATIAVVFNKAPVVMLPPNIITCADTTIVLTAPASNNFVYQWNTGETSQSIIANASGNYSVVVSNAACATSDNMTLTLNPLPTLNLGEDKTICLDEGQSLQLNAGQNFNQYNWNTNDLSASIEVTMPGNYSVIVTDENGCTNADEITIIEQCATTVYVPNAFSPNNDGQNDTFKPTVKYIENYTFKIFNRYGQTVFSTTDINAAWDGAFKKIKQPVGVFSWLIEYAEQGGKSQKQKGNVTLIR